jgi:hypothetical protein
MPISPVQTIKQDVPGLGIVVKAVLRRFVKSGERGSNTKAEVNRNEPQKPSLKLFSIIVRSTLFRHLFSHMLLVIAEKDSKLSTIFVEN